MKAIATKLLAIQKELKPIAKDSVNPHFKNKYFDINSVIAELRPLLNKHGVVVLQPLVDDGIATIVLDTESGEQLVWVTKLPASLDAQKMGAAITYFRRYALVSTFMLEAEDDDGNSAVKAVSEAFKSPQHVASSPAAAMLGVCADCGTPNKLSKAGKKYCGATCWKKDEAVPSIQRDEEIPPPPFAG